MQLSVLFLRMLVEMSMATDARNEKEEHCVTIGNWWNHELVRMPVTNAVEVLGHDQVSVVTVKKVEQSQQVAKSLKRGATGVPGVRHQLATYKDRLATKRIQSLWLRIRTRQQFDLLQVCMGLRGATWEEILLEAIEQIPKLLEQL